MRQLKISKPTFKHVVPSTASQSSATNLQVIPKGKQPLCRIFRLKHSIRRTHRFAYVEFAEPEFIDPALALDNSLFHGRLIKVCLDSCVMTTPLLRLFRFARFWRKGPMYQGSTEDEEGDEAEVEAVIEVVTEAVSEAEEDTVPTGGTVAGMSLRAW